MYNRGIFYVDKLITAPVTWTAFVILMFFFLYLSFYVHSLC
jgi:hypothetical protein